jgi:basic amino acid/polyamine antiporter, APA family
MDSRSGSDLRPTLTRLNAIALVAGTIIGASIFVQPSEIAQHLSRPVDIMLVWLACGVLTLFGALVCAELASAFPHTGGLYIFLRETFSPLAGFLWGWAMFWIMHTGIIAIIAMVFARYTAYFVPVGDAGMRATAVSVILGLSALNYVGVRGGSRVQTVLTCAKILAIGAIVVVGFALMATGRLSTVVGSDPLRGGMSGAPVTDFLLAMVAGLFAYGGWPSTSTRRPCASRSISRARTTCSPAATIPTRSAAFR